MRHAMRVSPRIGYMLTCKICNPFVSFDRVGSQRLHNKHIPGARLGVRRKARRIVTEFVEQCRGIMKEKVRKALDSGCKLTLGVGTWK